jgi:hypothetical protein
MACDFGRLHNLASLTTFRNFRRRTLRLSSCFAPRLASPETLPPSFPTSRPATPSTRTPLPLPPSPSSPSRRSRPRLLLPATLSRPLLAVLAPSMPPMRRASTPRRRRRTTRTPRRRRTRRRRARTRRRESRTSAVWIFRLSLPQSRHPLLPLARPRLLLPRSRVAFCSSIGARPARPFASVWSTRPLCAVSSRMPWTRPVLRLSPRWSARTSPT